MAADHLPGVAEREKRCFAAELRQGFPAYAAQWHASHGRGHWVLVRVDTRAVVGHSVMFPVPRGRPPELNELPVMHEPGPGMSLYIHDVSIDPPFRGRGHVERLLDSLPRDVDVELVAAPGLDVYWRRHGFAPVPCLTALTTYGGSKAVYMRRG